MRLERQFGREITAWMLRELRRTVKAAQNGNYHNPSDEELAQMLLPRVTDAAQRGAQVGMLPLVEIGMDFDAYAVNQAAADFARRHVYHAYGEFDRGLAAVMNETTRKAVQKEVSAWIAEPNHKQADLMKRLAPTFGPDRARTVAITEITNAYAGGAIEGWRDINRQAGVAVITGKRWATANDERVCFPAWTMVETETGPMPIQDIRPGMLVHTRYGLRPVRATSSRRYSGDMVTVRAGRHVVTSTADHPYWTLEQGWLEGRNLNRCHTLQTFDQKRIRVHGVAKFSLGNANDSPAVSRHVLSFAAISLFVPMPVGTIHFEGDAQIRKQKVNTVAPHFGLLDEGQPKRQQEQANIALKHVLTSEGTITGEATKLSIGVLRFPPDFTAAISTGDDNRRAAAFLRTKAGRPSGLVASKRLAASLTGVSLAGISTLPATDGIAISYRAVDDERLTANGANLRNLVSSVGVVAGAATIRASLAQLCSGHWLATLRTRSGGRAGMNSVALLGAERHSGLAALQTLKGLLTNRACVLKRHTAQLLNDTIISYHRLLLKPLFVYDLEVEEHPEFYADGLLVHNCPICAPLGGLYLEGSVTVAQSEETQGANAQRSGLGDVFTHPGGAGLADKFKGQTHYRPPAHPRCRCWVVPVVEEIPVNA